MHSLYISSWIQLDNELERVLHGNELRINPVAGWITDHHYELSDSGPSGKEGGI